MAKLGKLYSVYSRKSRSKKDKQKPLFYARFRRPDGTWTPGKATGQTSEGAAEGWAQNYLKGGQVIERESVTLKEYAADFFKEGSRWATDKKLSGKRVSTRSCLENQAVVDGRIIPLLGKRRLSEIDRAVVKDFRRDLHTVKGLAYRTINKTLSCLKMILEYAEDDKLIQAIPRIERAANEALWTRGILTIEEAKEVLKEQNWTDFRAYVANLLAASSGLRMSEILGLRRSCLKDGYIEITKAWNQKTRKLNDTTKNGHARYVPLPNLIIEKLKEIMKLSEYKDDDDFIFASLKKRKVPMDYKAVLDGLRGAMVKTGIFLEEQKARRIDCHSWRHWLNSILINGNIPLYKVRSVLGHIQESTSEGYYHPDDFRDVLKIQEEILK